MVKRFRQQKGSWLSYGGFLLQQGQSDAASALLQRALQSLPSTDSEERTHARTEGNGSQLIQ